MGIKKKRSNTLYALAMIVMFVLMTFNYDGPDIEVYRLTYDLIGNAADLQSACDVTYMEKGYSFIMFCANKAGLDFYSFRIVLTIICLALFASVIKYYKVNPNFIVGLYMVYLFFFDTIQLRNCIIQFIILFATRYLFRKSGISLLKYIVCIVIAGTIHTLAFLFLSLLLVRFVQTKIGYKRIFGIAAFIFIICVILQPVLPQILEAISKMINRGSSYFNTLMHFNYWVVMALHMLGLLPLYWYRKNIANENARKKIDKIMKIEIVLGLFLPLCFINSNFNRIFRNILILDTIGLALVYENSRAHTESKQVSLWAQLLLTAGWLVTDLYRNRNQPLINDIMKYNLLYEHLDSLNVSQCLIVIGVCLLVYFVLKILFTPQKNTKKKVVKCA